MKGSVLRGDKFSFLRPLLITLFLLVQWSVAQISPGDLSEPHKDLEGIGNCTQCHTIGKEISNSNCLTCHKEIDSRIAAGKGYHATVKGTQCIECHKEHHGRSFTLIRFDKKNFDHAQTGFRLEGKHGSLQCEQCHTGKNIAAEDIRALSDKRKSTTFLGLGTTCRSCHADNHRGQFSQECTQCHTVNGWKPVVKFSHDRARFRLTGSHEKVQCGLCHKKTWQNGAATQYVQLEFGTCTSCHTDPHRGKFRQECSSCHTTESWRKVGITSFDHQTTLFPLKGKHAALKCAVCHPADKTGKNPNGEPGFRIARFGKCTDCHADAHAKQFAARADGGDCQSCHTEEGFAPSTFTLTAHDGTRFSLLGAHRAVSCAGCHKEGKVKGACTRQFRWNEELKCITCHEDVHKGEFKQRMTNGCETCHTVNAWEAVTFSHDKTKFPLKGKHAELTCKKCHTTPDGVSRYTGLPMQCAQCHTDVHAGQFQKNGATACARCHTEKGWKALVFDHDTQSRFSLTGKHRTVRCEQCHKETMIKNQRTILYRPMEAACVDCHPAQ